jgi:hypothetical protein
MFFKLINIKIYSPDRAQNKNSMYFIIKGIYIGFYNVSCLYHVSLICEISIKKKRTLLYYWVK